MNAQAVDVHGRRTLVTLLFSDIVDSTVTAANLGDFRWAMLLDAFRQVVGHEIARFDGQEVDTSGDGFLAAFDGPLRAIRCAFAIVVRIRPMGLELRSGLHTGECEVIRDRLEGMSVHIGARIADLAAPGEILVSRTLKDVVIGAELTFRDRGLQKLRGVPDRRRLFAVST